MPVSNFHRLESLLAIALATSLILLDKKVLAQITSDGTTNTQTNVSESITTITGGTQAGQNLFHSFEQFSLSEGAAAYFNNSTEIENIFSRVTGGSISEIDGLLGANGDASLFLINPAGIIFGANAQLNLGGSFIAATSDSVVFEDGSQYNAVRPLEKPLLTVSSPIGLQYGLESGAIVSRANLSVDSGKTLALVGNNVSLRDIPIDISFSAFRKVQIGSVASGKVNLEARDGSWNLDYVEVTKFAQLNLSTSFIDTSGVGGIVSLQGEAIILNNAVINNATLFEGDGGKIELQAIKSIQLTNSFLSTQVGTDPNRDSAIAGTGGDILLAAPQIKLTNNSIVSAGTFGLGKGGNITIKAAEVELSGDSPAFITTSTEGGSGAGGRLTVNTGKLILRNGSQLQALAGQGNGGAIVVNASESVELSGTGSTSIFGGIELIFNSGLFASSGSENRPFKLQPDGKSGNLTIDTPRLLIADNAIVSVSNFGAANAGNIEINAAEVNLTAGEIIANTASGKGGSIAIDSDNLIILQQAAQISTNAERNGNGGNIKLFTDNLVLFDASKIAADAQEGAGGNIAIETRGYFIDLDSEVTASSSFGTDGIVEIVTPDAGSNFETAPPERSPLTAETYITTGCGASEDFAKNQFRNLGRGGVPPNIQERTTMEVWEDLGFSRSLATEAALESSSVSSAEENKIVEANDWIVNDSGKVQLVATNASSVVASASCKL